MIFGQIHDLSLEKYTLKDKRNTLYTVQYYLSIIVYDLKLLVFVTSTGTSTTTTTDNSLVDSIVLLVFLKCYYCFMFIILL